MKNTFKLLTITVLGCVCIDSSDAMEYQMTSKQINQWKEQNTAELDKQLTAAKMQMFQLQNDVSAKNADLEMPLLEWKIQLLRQEKQLIDGYNVNNSKRIVFSLVELIYQMTQANEALYKLLTNQVDAGNLSLAKQAVQVKQGLQEIPADHPIHQNFARFSELVVLYNQSNDEKEKAEILKQINNLREQIKQMF